MFYGSGKALPKENENAIRQAYQDYQDGKFLKPDAAKGKIYVDATEARDKENFRRLGSPSPSRSPTPERTDVQRYAFEKWGNLDSPEAKAFMANFEQALMAKCFIMSAIRRPVTRARPAASTDWTALPATRLRFLASLGWTAVPKAVELLGLFGMGNRSPGLPDPGIGSTGMMFSEDGTPRPVSIRPHPATPGDPTGGVDVTLKDGGKEHWWNDQIDGFIRSKISPFDGGAPAVSFAPPPGAIPNSVQPGASPRPGNATQTDAGDVRVLARIPAPGATPSLPDNANTSQQAAAPPGLVSGQPMPDYPVPPYLFGLRDQSAASGDDMDDWDTRWIKPLVRP